MRSKGLLAHVQIYTQVVGLRRDLGAARLFERSMKSPAFRMYSGYHGIPHYDKIEIIKSLETGCSQAA